MNEEYFVDKELYDNLSASFSALEIQLDKYKNVIEKIREYSIIISDSDYVYTQDKIAYKILELLEEVE